MVPKRDPNHVDPIVTNISIKRAINDYMIALIKTAKLNGFFFFCFSRQAWQRRLRGRSLRATAVVASLSPEKLN
jgi:hypothetical protein